MNLRDYTSARVSLGITGASQTTRDHLAFQLAHAEARDAVHASLDIPALAAALKRPSLTIHSAAKDRSEYLRRPDLGRKLNQASREKIAAYANTDYDLTITIADGLSALAIMRHAANFLETLHPMFPSSWRIAPLLIAQQARVALCDSIGDTLSSTLSLVLIGERPGLSSPDSLGAYITYRPQTGRTDAERNCVSNIRAAGLSYTAAARTLAYLLTESHTRRLSGIPLKEDDTLKIPQAAEPPR